MKIFVERDRNFTEEINYVFRTLAHANNVPVEFVSHVSDAEVSAGSSSLFTFHVSEKFYTDISSKNFSHRHHLNKDCVILKEDGEPDYLSTIFYMLNSLQEYADTDVDEIGRFKYTNSYQSRFGNIEDNLVGRYSQKVLASQRQKSRIFLSHDIDSVNGALLQDSFFLLKKGNPLPVFKLVMNAALQRPDWLNMDKIMKIEDEHSLKSTFFWLVNKGRLNRREVNSDYNIDSSKIRTTLKSIESGGWENGLHKSISGDSYKEELSKLGLPAIANRNHYLKFRLPDLYSDIEASGLQLDASLGFAEAVGFRNSFGLPFHPFNLKERKPHSFVEVPLTVMDGTLKQYRGVPMDETAPQIISFLEKNKTDCVISILWHNTYFTDYKFGGYLRVYKQILEYIQANGMRSINPREIVEEFAWQKY
jgi:peptidoglycan/xylan/chitin deacetylase (PgdA/CDA1 family)